MKNIINKLFLLLAFALCSVTSLCAKTKYVTANLNMRYGAGVEYAILTTIPRGTAVEIIDDCDCDWVRVKYGNRCGWVCTGYLSAHKPLTHRTAAPTSGVSYYNNVNGVRVQSPTRYSSRPAGATARCRDGSYSFSRSRRGTCSHHGGVVEWY